MSTKPFPPRIMAVLHELADRKAKEFAGPAEDGIGDPLRDDADEAIAWIEALSLPVVATADLTEEQRGWLPFARSLLQMAGELPAATSSTEEGG